MEKDDSTCLEPRRLGTDFWFHRRIHHMALMKPAPPGQPNLPLLLKPYLLTDELKGLRESATRFHYGVYARNAGLSLVKTLSPPMCYMHSFPFYKVSHLHSSVQRDGNLSFRFLE